MTKIFVYYYLVHIVIDWSNLKGIKAPVEIVDFDGRWGGNWVEDHGWGWAYGHFYWSYSWSAHINTSWVCVGICLPRGLAGGSLPERLAIGVDNMGSAMGYFWGRTLGCWLMGFLRSTGLFLRSRLLAYGSSIGIPSYQLRLSGSNLSTSLFSFKSSFSDRECCNLCNLAFFAVFTHIADIVFKTYY